MRCLVYILFKEFGESIKEIINEDIGDGYVRYHGNTSFNVPQCVLKLIKILYLFFKMSVIHVLLLLVQNKRCRLEDRVRGEKSNLT
ncbi:hypothetical protein Hdeb2414_s0020g00557721 [Helianthus debilis subsp. tardiflorus]